MQTNMHYNRRLQAVENARANSIAFFEPKKLEDLLDVRREIEEARVRQRSKNMSYSEIVEQADRIRRMPGSGSILDPNRQEE